MNALVIQPAFLGDAILSLSLAEELKRRVFDAKISYLVRPEASSIIALSPCVHKVYTFDKYKSESGISGVIKKAKELNADHFDVVFALHSSKRTLALVERLEIEEKIGYGNHREFTKQISDNYAVHTQRAVHLLSSLLDDVDVLTLPRLQSARSDIPPAVLQLHKPIAVVSTDSVWKTKQWGAEKFILLIGLLESDGFSIVLTGVQDIFGGMNLSNHFGEDILNLIGKTTLTELAAIIEYSDLVISNDSAVAHIATAVRTRSITIFGPTLPEFGFAQPPELGSVIDVSGLWCRPCSSHGGNECPTHTHDCMKLIKPEKVFHRVKSVIEGTGIGAETVQ
ncbi:MAG: glycosyltransferase family 9 protein [bacterium]